MRQPCTGPEASRLRLEMGRIRSRNLPEILLRVGGIHAFSDPCSAAFSRFSGGVVRPGALGAWVGFARGERPAGPGDLQACRAGPAACPRHRNRGCACRHLHPLHRARLRPKRQLPQRPRKALPRLGKRRQPQSRAAEPAAQAAAAAAGPSTAELEKRIADLEAYVNNGARADAETTKVRWPRSRPQRLDDDLRGARAVHDAARSRAVLRRSRAQQECAHPCSRNVSASPGSSHPLVGASVTASSSRRATPFIGGTEVRVPRGVDAQPNANYAVLGLAERVRDVSS